MAGTIPSASDSIVCVDESALLRISGLARSTRRNWVKISLIADRPDGRYYERDVIETVLVAVIIRATKRLDDARRVWRATREKLLSAAADLPADGQLALALELRLLRSTVVTSTEEIGAAARPFEASVLIPISQPIREAREAFRTFAAPTSTKPDRRRREAKVPASASPRGRAPKDAR
jgi:hypothetical protein